MPSTNYWWKIEHKIAKAAYDNFKDTMKCAGKSLTIEPDTHEWKAMIFIVHEHHISDSVNVWQEIIFHDFLFFIMFEYSSFEKINVFLVASKQKRASEETGTITFLISIITWLISEINSDMFKEITISQDELLIRPQWERSKLMTLKSTWFSKNQRPGLDSPIIIHFQQYQERSYNNGHAMSQSRYFFNKSFSRLDFGCPYTSLGYQVKIVVH